MIEYVTGDFFDFDADIRVNTVNCVGVMGAGVALEFKNRYPEMFKEYVKVCKKGEIEPGKPYLWEEYDLFSRCLIINLPTKIHWRNPSEYEYIEKDLIWLREYLKDMSEETTMTLPALGCGHGGLDWNVIKGKIEHYLGDLKVRILLFDPTASNRKKNDPHYGIHNLEKDIKVIYPDDKKYMQPKKASDVKEIYCKGNTELLLEKKLTLVCGNDVSEKETSAISQTLRELKTKENVSYSLILGLNNRKHLALAKELMEQGIDLILVLPYGVSKFKYHEELEEYKGKYVLVSYVVPNQDFKRFEYIHSLKYRSAVADAILYCNENVSDIRQNVKYFKTYENFFYINFWKEQIPEFVSIAAKKIGIHPETKKPNVTLLEEYLRK